MTHSKYLLAVALGASLAGMAKAQRLIRMARLPGRRSRRLPATVEANTRITVTVSLKLSNQRLSSSSSCKRSTRGVVPPTTSS